MTMTLPEIERTLTQLRLSGVRDTLETRTLQARGANQPFLETFSLILQDELERRQSRLVERSYPSRTTGLSSAVTRSMPGFKTFRCARILLGNIELMHMTAKGQMKDSGSGQTPAAQFYSLAI